MADFISLEEAARELGLDPEELRAKAQAREVRAFQDSGSWQFRRADVEELARRLGMGSDPDLSLSDLDLDVTHESGSEDIDLSEFQLGVATPDVGPASGDQDVRVDDLAVPPELTGSSSTIIGMKPAGKQPSDSDVKLVPEDITRGAGDSDVRLATPPGRPGDSDVTLVSDDSSEHDVDDPNATTLARSPLLGSSGEIEAVSESGSDFELTPSSVIDALQPESGSDFELTALDASDDDFDATPAPKRPSDSDVTGIEPSASGINLGRPSDSGINLGTGGGFDLTSDSVELAPLDDDVSPAPKPAPKPTPRPAAIAPKDDPGATALPIRGDSGEQDIFEDTDFEVDAIGETPADDRTVQLEATSDFDIDDGDSASEVFALDEDDVDQNAATAMASAPDLSDDAFSTGSDSGEQDAWGDVASTPELDTSAAPAVAAVGASAGAATAAAPRAPGSALLTNAQGPDWGTPWVVLLGLTTVLMMLLAFVGLDLVMNLYEFRGSGVSAGLVKTIAGLAGGG